jgi:hypothetical protein
MRPRLLAVATLAAQEEELAHSLATTPPAADLGQCLSDRSPMWAPPQRSVLHLWRAARGAQRTRVGGSRAKLLVA